VTAGSMGQARDKIPWRKGGGGVPPWAGLKVVPY